MNGHETPRREPSAPDDKATSAPVADAAGAPVPVLAVSGLERRFGRVVALAGVELAVRPGEIVVLLGPSGAGKTTLLKIVAGLVRADRGRVMLAGRDLAVWPRHGIGMVFHERGAFRSLRPAAGRGFPFGRPRVPRAEARANEASALALVGLTVRERRQRLSGGQALRRALAQAIASDPVLLLLDECFAALGRDARGAMQAEIRRLQRRLGIATLLATQEPETALPLADRIAAMDAGRIVQIGTPEALHRRPASRFVAELLGEANFFRGRAGVIRGSEVEVRLESGGAMRATLPPGDRSVHYGADLALMVRPDRPRRLAHADAAENRAAGTVADAAYLGEIVRYRLALEGGGALVLRWPAAAERLRLGERVELGWSAADTTAMLWA